MSKIIMKSKKEDKGLEKKVTKAPSKTSTAHSRGFKSLKEAEEMKRKTDELLNKERSRLLDQIADLIKELEHLRSENERLQKRHDEKRIPPEVVDKMKRDLDRAKSTNHFLLNDVEDRKKQITRMEAQIFELTMKVEAMSKKVSEVRKLNSEYKLEIAELTVEKGRFDRLMDENRKLRKFLAMNQIDSATGKPLAESIKDKRIYLTKKAVTIKDTVKSRNMEIANRRKLRATKSLEDLRKMEAYYDSKSNGISKQPAPYIGQYTDIMKKRRSFQKKK